MFQRLFAAVLCMAFFSTAQADSVPVPAFHGEYRVLRNGDPIGKATLTLRRTGDHEWEFSSHTRGTSGLARLLGVNVSETSTFRWQDGRLHDLHYRYSQDAAIKSKSREIDFDWNQHRAELRDGNKSRDIALPPDAIDRSLVTVALMASLRTSRTSVLEYPVVHSNAVLTERYADSGRELLNLPAGRIETVRIERDHGKRRTISWFAPKLGWMPVQIRQVQKSGKTITMQLETSHSGP